MKEHNEWLRKRNTGLFSKYDGVTGDFWEGLRYLGERPADEILGEWWYNKQGELQIELFKGEKMKTQKMLTAEGVFINNDDTHWAVRCPVCGGEFVYWGFYDKDKTSKCPCGCVFKTNRVYFENGDYIGEKQ